jgi:hypothetical protein
MTSLRNVFQMEQISQTQNKTRQKKHYLLGTRLPHDTDRKLLLNDLPQKRFPNQTDPTNPKQSPKKPHKQKTHSTPHSTPTWLEAVVEMKTKKNDFDLNRN